MVVNPSVPSAKPADSGTAAVDQALAEFEAARAQPYYDEATDRADRDAYYAPLGGRPPPASALSNHLEATHSPRVRYDSGRSIYTWADLHEDQLLRSIYSGATFDPREAIAEVVLLDQRIQTLEARMADGRVSESAGVQEIDLLEAASPYNCEHVVPQSWFRRSEPMRGDMHHLFACGNRCNSFRGNTPYFDFPDFQDVVQDDCGKRLVGVRLRAQERQGDRGARDPLFPPSLSRPYLQALPPRRSDPDAPGMAPGHGAQSLRTAPQSGDLQAPGQSQPAHRLFRMGGRDRFRRHAGGMRRSRRRTAARVFHSAAAGRPGGLVQRSAEASSACLASTQIVSAGSRPVVPGAYSTCFQNGARVLR